MLGHEVLAGLSAPPKNERYCRMAPPAQTRRNALILLAILPLSACFAQIRLLPELWTKPQVWLLCGRATKDAQCLLYSIQHHPLKPSKLHFVAPPIIPPGIAPPQALISGAPGMHADMLGGTPLPSGPRRSRPPLRSAGIELIAPVARTTPRPCGCLSLAPSRSIR